MYIALQLYCIDALADVLRITYLDYITRGGGLAQWWPRHKMCWDHLWVSCTYTISLDHRHAIHQGAQRHDAWRQKATATSTLLNDKCYHLRSRKQPRLRKTHPLGPYRFTILCYTNQRLHRRLITWLRWRLGTRLRTGLTRLRRRLHRRLITWLRWRLHLHTFGFILNVPGRHSRRRRGCYRLTDCT